MKQEKPEKRWSDVKPPRKESGEEVPNLMSGNYDDDEELEVPNFMAAADDDEDEIPSIMKPFIKDTESKVDKEVKSK